MFAAGTLECAAAPPASGTTVLPIAPWLAQVLSAGAVRQAASSAVASLPVKFQLHQVVLPGIQPQDLDTDGAVILGAENWQCLGGSWDPQTGGAFLDLGFVSLTVSGNLSLAGLDVGSLTSSPFPATATLHVTGTGAAASAGVRAAIEGIVQFTFQDGPQFTPDDIGRASLAGSFMSCLSERLAPVLGAAVMAAGRRSTLTLLAQGGAGGRGQDGHDGIAGKGGVAGVTPPAGETGLVQNGLLVAYPSEAAGTAGSAGGAAGNAGHSTPGATGGRVQITLSAGAPAQLVISAEGGRGGDAAAAGAPGRAGTGGAGAEIEVYVAGDPPGTVQSWTAPSGTDGAWGALPTFAGAVGADGARGVVTLNGSAIVAPTTITAPASVELSTLVPLTLLVLTDRCNSVDHLNAHSAADLASVVTRYRWLAAVTELFAAGNDPTNGTFDAREVAVRRSINQSAKLELARISEGLDYFGDAFNWVPVLSMTALQARVSSLLDVGKMIEDTYLAYQNQDATIEARLSSLNNAQQHLQTKINNDNDTITELATEIKSAHSQVLASLGPIEAQQNRLATAEFEFKEQFIDYVLSQATQCTFLGVLKAILGIVEFAAEAISGIGEIQALGEAKTVFEFATGVVEVIKVAEAEIEAIQKAVESVQELLDTDVDAAKIVVDEKKFDNFIAQYLGKFPAANELADAVHQYFALVRAHNKLALAYTGLCIKRARLEAEVAQAQAGVEAIAAKRAGARAEEVLPEYDACMTGAYWNLKAGLLRELYEFNRAYTYWSLLERQFVASDETVANLASTYADWTGEIDTFLEQSGPMQPFQQQIEITAADYPEAFVVLPQTRRLNLFLDITKLLPKYFADSTHVVATTLNVGLPAPVRCSSS
jgi:hypothetical protein